MEEPSSKGESPRVVTLKEPELETRTTAQKSRNSPWGPRGDPKGLGVVDVGVKILASTPSDSVGDSPGNGTRRELVFNNLEQ